MTACEPRRDIWKCCICSLSFEFSSADADAGGGSSLGPEGGRGGEGGGDRESAT